MIIYGTSLSPYVRKVLAFAAEKGIELEVKPVGLGAKEPEFLEASPFGKMPALRDGDFVVSDSTAIIAYLEAIKPQPALIPTEAKARARAIWFEEFADTLLISCAAKMFVNRVVAPRFQGREGDLGAADKAEREELPPILDYLERIIPESGFLVEDRLTIADIAVVSPIANFAYCSATIDPDRYPRLRAYAEAILSRPSFKGLTDREKAFLARAA